MKKLKQLKEAYKRSPVTRQVVDQAIQKHGEDAEAMVVGGQPTFRKGSNCRRRADFYGWQEYDLYVGAKIQHRSMGNLNVLVRIKLN